MSLVPFLNSHDITINEITDSNPGLIIIILNTITEFAITAY